MLTIESAAEPWPTCVASMWWENLRADDELDHPPERTPPPDPGHRSKRGTAAVKIVVVGAGVAGLAAARALAASGHKVTALDKGRRAGGRLSTKEFANGGRADAGAQLITVSSAEFAEAVEEWQVASLVHEWGSDSSSDDGHHPRYAVRGGMSRLASALASGLDVRCSIHVEQVCVATDGVVVSWPRTHGHDAGRLVADAVILTVPSPQVAALLGSDVPVPSVTYLPTLSLMVALDRAVEICPTGALQVADHPVWSFVGDNQMKGTSTMPVLTFQSTSSFAAARFDDPVAAVTGEMLEAARPFLKDAAAIETQLQRWRYAMPVQSCSERLFVAGEGRIILAGDAFGSPTVEGAFLSGLGAAEQIDRGGASAERLRSR